MKQIEIKNNYASDNRMATIFSFQTENLPELRGCKQ